MAIVMCIPIITESDYPAFQQLGIASQFPDDYSAFLELLKKEEQKLHARGIVTDKVNVDAAGFQQWFGGRGKATYSDLFKYAASVVERNKD